MFDIGFWEIVLISIIGLVVLGPERLPVAIRTVRGWISGARQFSNTVKTELQEELRIHELHNNLKQAEQQNMENLNSDISSSVKSLKEAAAMVTRPYEKAHSETPTTTSESEVCVPEVIPPEVSKTTEPKQTE
jgi:sec-independent protein translocase protein TatB